MTLDRIAAFVVDTAAAGAPAEVDAAARDRLLDTLAAGAAGVVAPASRVALAYASSSSGPAPVWATGVRGVPERAAFAGATCASALDLDDGHYGGGGIHPGSTVVPALLAVADDDQEVTTLRTALVVGYEVAIRAGARFSPAATGETYRATGHASVVGATAALCALRGVGAGTVRAALRIALAHAPSAVLASAGAKEAIGWAAATAVAAVELAVAGFDPDGTPVGSIFRTTALDDPAVAATLGERWELLDVYTKPAPVCQGAQAALEALEALDELADLADLDDVAGIDVDVAPGSAAVLGDVATRDLASRQFSIPDVLGRRLVRGRLGPLALLTEDPDADRIAALVHVRDESLGSEPGDGYPTRLTVRTRTGGVLTREVRMAIGGPGRPLAPAAFLERCRAALAVAFDPAEAEQVIGLVHGGDARVGDLRRPAPRASRA
ncbi:MmgE/PrpD family protein [Agromyces sp. SYSU T00194]|uniref:MmgE/PrpD family protein n=1 Tax=Agromyces chitinivorans TaxID=3158560 RepID=UPI003395F44E